MDAVSLIQGTAVASFVMYTVALLLRLRRSSTFASTLWTAAFLLMAVHVALAFHFVHHWSHADATLDTARQTADVFGIHWGGGVFANYALLLVWGVDVIRWWRGRWSGPTQVFLAFMWFNGVVVFGHGLTRWLGAVAFGMLLFAWWHSRRRSATPHAKGS